MDQRTIRKCTTVLIWAFITLWSSIRNSVTRFKKLSPPAKIQIKLLTDISQRKPSEVQETDPNQEGISRKMPKTSKESLQLARLPLKAKTTCSKGWDSQALAVIHRPEWAINIVLIKIKPLEIFKLTKGWMSLKIHKTHLLSWTSMPIFIKMHMRATNRMGLCLRPWTRVVRTWLVITKETFITNRAKM